MARTAEDTALFRVYADDELGDDGYPHAWHQLDFTVPIVADALENFGIKDVVRANVGNRCERCHHPYIVGGVTTWVEIDGKNTLITRCDDQCTHDGPIYVEHTDRSVWAPWRVLTVHHLNGNKADCRWWNLAALDQRCHLTIQGKVVMERAFIFEHSEWFRIHAAGFYAEKYLGESLTREQASARQDELLALEQLA